MMTDIDINKICADAMGLRIEFRSDAFGDRWLCPVTDSGWRRDYNPLLDDAQMTAIVKAFRPTITPFASSQEWRVDGVGVVCSGVDLNRAVCMFVVTCAARGILGRVKP